jgi:hypothetical protein
MLKYSVLLEEGQAWAVEATGQSHLIFGIGSISNWSHTQNDIISLHFTFKPMNEQGAHAIAKWHYQGPTPSMMPTGTQTTSQNS